MNTRSGHMFHPSIRMLRVAVLSGVACFCSCSTVNSPLASDQYEGVFVLSSIEGDSLPADAQNETDAGAGLVTSVLADTLVFMSGGLGHWSNVWRRRFLASGVVVDSSHRRMPFRYVRSGDEIRITFLAYCPDCREVYSDEAHVVSNGVLDRSYVGNWRYTRIAAAAP